MNKIILKLILLLTVCLQVNASDAQIVEKFFNYLEKNELCKYDNIRFSDGVYTLINPMIRRSQRRTDGRSNPFWKRVRGDANQICKICNFKTSIEGGVSWGDNDSNYLYDIQENGTIEWASNYLLDVYNEVQCIK